MYQDSISCNTQLHALDDLTSLQYKVLRHIIYYGTKSWGFCRKTYKKIADECGCSESFIDKLIRSMKDNFLLLVSRKGRNASHIHISDKLKDWYFSVKNSIYGTSTERRRRDYIDKYKKSSYTSVDNSIVDKSEKKNRFDFFNSGKRKMRARIQSELKDLGLGNREASTINGYICKHGVDFGVFMDATSAVYEKSQKEHIGNLAAYLMGVIKNKQACFESERRELKANLEKQKEIEDAIKFTSSLVQVPKMAKKPFDKLREEAHERVTKRLRESCFPENQLRDAYEIMMDAEIRKIQRY